MGSITPAMKHFLSAEKYAVIGRVMTDRSRFDNKACSCRQASPPVEMALIARYIDRGLPVTPVRPGAEGGQAEDLEISTEPNSLPDLSRTSISIIIHPSKSLPILQSLYPVPPGPNEPHGAWFQPGADDEAVRAYVKERGLEDQVVVGGRCVLVDGDRILRSLGEGGKL